MTDYTVDGKQVKAVQYDGDWDTIGETFPSLVLFVDGENRVFFEKDDVRHYVEKGDWVVLAGPKYTVESEFHPDKPKPAPRADDKDK
jgi:hypothetical protein